MSSCQGVTSRELIQGAPVLFFGPLLVPLLSVLTPVSSVDPFAKPDPAENSTDAGDNKVGAGDAQLPKFMYSSLNDVA